MDNEIDYEALEAAKRKVREERLQRFLRGDMPKRSGAKRRTPEKWDLILWRGRMERKRRPFRVEIIEGEQVLVLDPF